MEVVVVVVEVVDLVLGGRTVVLVFDVVEVVVEVVGALASLVVVVVVDVVLASLGRSRDWFRKNG